MAFIGLNTLKFCRMSSRISSQTIFSFMLFIYFYIVRISDACVCSVGPSSSKQFDSHLNGSMFSLKIEIRSESIMKDYLYHDMGHMSQIRKVISVCCFFFLFILFICMCVYISLMWVVADETNCSIFGGTK